MTGLAATGTISANSEKRVLFWNLRMSETAGKASKKKLQKKFDKPQKNVV